MPLDNLDILVLLREVSDPRPPARTTARGGGVSERGLRRVPNPSDLSALEEALQLKEKRGARVTVLAVGPASVDDALRGAVAMGADRVIRCWDHGLEGGDAVADARVLARAVAILKPHLVVSGNRLIDRGDDPAPALAAAQSGIPCVGSVLAFTPERDGVKVLRKGDRGSRQTVETGYPCLLLCEEERTPRYPELAAVLDALSHKIERWGMAELGIPFWEVGASGAALPAARVAVPRLDPVRLVTPDPQLPAYERILSLLSGGIKAREGKLAELSADATAQAIWDLLSREGVVATGAEV